MNELENKIREALPHLQKVEKGQRFLSKYYGIIVATKVDALGGGNYDIYGFDEMEGLPRSNYYPRELELVGHPIKLNDVLQYLKIKEGNIVDTTDNDNLIGLQKDFEISFWNLSSVFLADQNEGLKEFLNRL